MGKKIILLGSAHPLRGGGLATFNERLARELLAQGHDCVIWTFSLQYPSFLFPGKSQYSDDPPPEGLDIRVKVNSINPFNWIKVGRQLRKEAPDLLLMRYWIPFIGPSQGTIARKARKNGKTKVVSIIDNMIPHEKRPGDRWFSKYFVKAVDGFIAMSRAVLEDIGQFDTKKPRVFTPHPMYDNFGEAYPKAEARKSLDLPTEGRYILFFGFVRAYKGLDLLLEAMADPRIRELGVKVIVAGEYYSDPKPYLDIISEKQLDDQVIQRSDFIPNGEVGRYFSAADVVVQPYKDATQSGVTQIAYHFDKPMIVTNVGGLPEIVPDGKVGYVTPVEVPAIADAIVKFYADEKEAEFVKGVQEEKKRFEWGTFVGEILKLADSV